MPLEQNHDILGDPIRQFNEFIKVASAKRDTSHDLHTILRERRMHLPYLRTLLVHCDEQKRYPFAKAICEHVLKHYNAPRFKKYLTAIEGMETDTKDGSAA